MQRANVSPAVNTSTTSTPVRTLRSSCRKPATASIAPASAKTASTSSLLARRRSSFRWEKWELTVLLEHYRKNKCPDPAKRHVLACALAEMRSARGGAPLRQRSVSVREEAEEVPEYERGLTNWFKNRRAMEKRQGQRRRREEDGAKEDGEDEEREDERYSGTGQWLLRPATSINTATDGGVSAQQDGTETTFGSEYYYPVVANSVSGSSRIGLNWRRPEYQRCYEGQYGDATWETCNYCRRGENEAMAEEADGGGGVADRFWTASEKAWGAIGGGYGGRAAVTVAGEDWREEECAAELSSYSAVGASGFIFSRGVLVESYERCKAAA